MKDLIKGIYAGILIGIGAVVYLSVSNKIVGSLLFSIGLLTICMYKMNLYTGKIGYLLNEKPKYLITLLMTIIGNFIGTYLVGFVINNTRLNSVIDTAKTISKVKLNDNLLSIFILSIFCGILMYLAVNSFKKNSEEIAKYITVIMCIMVFILCGFEHCVANMAYFSIAGLWSLKALKYTIVMILGNSVGSIFISLFDKYFLNNN